VTLGILRKNSLDPLSAPQAASREAVDRIPFRLVVVKKFFHVGPPLTWVARLQRILAGFADIPPLLGAGIRCHAGHVCIEVISDILEVGKKKSILVVDGVVANPALGDLGENLRPSGGVQSFVFFVFLRAESDH